MRLANLDHQAVAALSARYPWAAATVVGALYFALGKLSALLAIPPGYATAVWPPAGLALAAALFCGPRVALGIVAGSMLGNALTAAASTSQMPMALALPMAVTMGIGAWLQAVVGARLLLRRMPADLGLVREHDITVFLLVGGPLSCLVSASIGVAALVATGATPAGDFAYSWWTWWVGDTIGVVIFAPLLLIAFGGDHPLWRRRRATVAGPLVLGFAVVVVLFVQVSERENNRLRHEFDRRATALGHALHQQFNENGEVAHAVVGLFHTATVVSRADFHTFADQMLARHPEIQALSYVQVVADADRAAYEAGVRAEGHPQFTITEEGPDGALRPASRRDWYAPVTYLQPMNTNAEAFGFDVSSEVSRRATLQKASDRGELLATPPIRLVQQPKGELGFLLVAPVFQRGQRPNSAAERQAALRGFITVVLLAQGVVEAELAKLDTTGTTLCLIDQTPEQPARILFAGFGAHRLQCTVHEPIRTARPGLSTAFTAAGRQLRADFAPTASYASDQRSWQPWSVLAVGLFFVALLGAVLLTLTGREMELATALDTAASNEARYRESEARAKAIVGVLPDLLFRQTRDGTYVDYAAPAVNELYAPPEVFLGKKAHEVLPPALADRIQATANVAYATGQLQRMEYRLPVGDATYDFEARIVPIGQDETVSLVRNITAAKRAEQALLDSLREKEVLLKEIHHRVKNNLQVICSLLNLQALRLDDPIAKAALTDCQNRVLSIALVHEKLYQSRDLSHIDARDYLANLLESVRHANNCDGRGIVLALHAADVSLTVDTAISCGLIVHELVSNAIKHAFLGRRNGRVAVSLVRHKGDELLLTVADDGIGMPADGRHGEPHALGLDLVHAFAQQLRAELRCETSEGTRFDLTFRAAAPGSHS